MIRINSPKGLGDAIHLRAIVLHLLERGEEIEVYTGWPEVFTGLPVVLRTHEQIADHDQIRHAMACLHCCIPEIMGMSLFQNACRQAGIVEPVALRMDWKVKDGKRIRRIKARAAGKPILLYQPVKKANNAQQAELRPDRDAYRAYLQGMKGYFRIKVGNAAFTIDDPRLPVDLDLFNKTTVSEVFDIATIADCFFSEDSYIQVIAQAMNKPVTWMFARKGESSAFSRSRNARPSRMIHRTDLVTVVYDHP